MAYKNLKDESYTNPGGMNTKASPYLTSVTECLNLINFDFSQVGSWTKRPGTTLWNGVTTTNNLPVNALSEFSKLNGSSAMFFTANNGGLYVSLPGGGATYSGLVLGKNAGFLSFVDHLFMTGQSCQLNVGGVRAWNFWKANDVTVGGSIGNAGMGFSTISRVGVPSPYAHSGSNPYFFATAAIGGSLCGSTTTFCCNFSWVNYRGFVGYPGRVFLPATGQIVNGATVVLDGVTYASILYGNLHLGDAESGSTGIAGYFGLTAFQILRSGPNDAILYGTTQIPFSTTFAIDSGIPLTVNQARYSISYTLNPRYMAVVNNQLFLAGFSNLPSTMYWSEVGEPEMIDATWNAEVRTNDGDRISGLSQFRSGGLVFKEKSFSEFKAYSATDVQIFSASTEYGCLSHRTILSHDSYTYFLDKKGIVQYDGAQPRIVSDRIENIFKSMNVDVARNYACAINNRQRNELWFAIPTNGATLNNTLVIYDYVANGWAVWTGLNICSLTYGYGGTATPRVIFGDESGRINEFGSSLTGDNGAGITCLIQTRFHHGLGDTVEKLYRRFFINSTPVYGATVALSINFYKNYGTSLIPGATAYQNPFQTQIDFGIPAKSISVEISNFSATNTVQIPGYALAYRCVRNL